MHRCIRCGNVYEDNDATILRGCTKCGAIFFLYIRTAEDVKQLDVQLDAVKEELQEKDTTLEKELVKEIKKRKIKREREKKRKAEKKEEIKEKPIKRVERAKRIKKEVIKIGEKKFAVEDIFGIETIRVPKDGVYEINIDALMKKRPIIVLERGKVYIIHLPSVFEGFKED